MNVDRAAFLAAQTEPSQCPAGTGLLVGPQDLAIHAHEKIIRMESKCEFMPAGAPGNRAGFRVSAHRLDVVSSAVPCNRHSRDSARLALELRLYNAPLARLLPMVAKEQAQPSGRNRRGQFKASRLARIF